LFCSISSLSRHRALPSFWAGFSPSKLLDICLERCKIASKDLLTVETKPPGYKRTGRSLLTGKWKVWAIQGHVLWPNNVLPNFDQVKRGQRFFSTAAKRKSTNNHTPPGKVGPFHSHKNV
jgi:hypothetical protein